MLIKKNVFTSSLLTLALAAVSSSSFAQSALETVIQNTNTKVLKELNASFAKTAKEEREEAIQAAKKHGWIIREEYKDGKIIEIHRLDATGQPVYRTTNNASAAVSTATNQVYANGGLGLSLSGSGMTIGEWDGGSVLLTHQEFGGRVTQTDGSTSLSSHATHVAGTLVAGGVVANAKGMAFQANLSAHDWFSDNAEMTTAAGNGLLVSNHSYGSVSGWSYNSQASEWYWYGNTSTSTTEDYKFGFYNNGDCRAWDQIAVNAPYYLIVKSAGNDRGDTHTGSHQVRDNSGNYVTSTATRDDDGGTDGFDCIPTGGNAKNILTVGAALDMATYTSPSSVGMTSFSGWGPTDDGRIKPDIVGNGSGVYSTDDGNNTDYSSKSGTSMSGPNVAGSLLLLQEHYEDVNNNYMRSASLKALAIHTAREAGPAEGPDYMFGWGILNMADAATLISTDNGQHILENSLTNGSSYSQTFYNNGTPIRATICWTDPAASANTSNLLNNTTPKLIHDLDIRIIDASGNSYQPYILNPASPNSAATRGDNFRDNVEQIYIAAPSAGLYTVTINHKGSLSSTQNYSLIIEGNEPPNNTASACLNVTDILTVSPNDAYSYISDVAFLANGTRYMTGGHYDDYTFAGTAITNTSGFYNGFVQKYNSNNTEAWLVNLSGTSNVRPGKIITDNSGNSYIYGYYEGTMQAGPYSQTNSTTEDKGFLVKVNNSGAVVWLRSIDNAASNSTIIAADLTFDANGFIYVTGRFTGTATFSPSVSITNSGAGYDGFVAKYNTAGTVQWANRYGSTTNSDGLMTITNINNDLYLGGYFSTSATYGSTTLNAAATNDIDAVLLKMSNAGTIQWARKMSGTKIEYVTDLTTDGTQLIAAFNYDSTAVIDGTSLTSPANAYGNAIFSASTTTGTVNWVNALSSSAALFINDITVLNNTIYAGFDFEVDLTVNGTTTNSAGGEDIAIVSYSSTGVHQNTYTDGGAGTERLFSLTDNGTKLSAAGEFTTSLNIKTTNLTTSKPIAQWSAILEYSQPLTLDAGLDTTIACNATTPIQLNASTNANSFTWFPTVNMTGSTSITPSVLPTATTNYIFTGLDGCGNIMKDTVTIVIDSLKNFTVDAGNTVTINCITSTTLNPSIVGIPNNTVTYNWIPTTNLSNASIKNPVANPSNSLNYTLQVTNACGVMKSDYVTVMVSNPTPSVSTPTTLSITCGDSVALQATTTGLAPFTFAWNNTTSLSSNSTANTTAKPNATTSYTITATDACGTSRTSTSTVTVNPITAPTVSLNSTVLTCQTTAVSYQWYLNGNIIVGATNSTYTAVSSGDYTVSIIDANGCSASSTNTTVTILPSTTLAINSNDNELKLYPSPNNGAFTLEYNTTNSKKLTYAIYNTNGQLIQQEKLNQNKTTVQLKDLHPGVYFVQLFDAYKAVARQSFIVR